MPPDTSLQRDVFDKVLGRGRPSLLLTSTLRDRVLTRQPAAAELSRFVPETRHAGSIMHLAVLSVCVIVASAAWPLDAELIPAPYLAPKYLAPLGAPSNTVIADRSEPGDRLIVTGRALDQGRPVESVSIYAFHADVDGLYTRDGRNSDENARLFATLRTDADGRYRYETIRPRGYDGLAAHVHHVVTAAGYKPRLCDLWLGDEPYFTLRRNAGLPLSEGAAMFVRTPTRDPDGVWRVTHDLEMLRESN